MEAGEWSQLQDSSANGIRLCSSLHRATCLPGLNQQGLLVRECFARYRGSYINSFCFSLLWRQRKCSSDGDLMCVCVCVRGQYPQLVTVKSYCQGVFISLKITLPLLDWICEVGRSFLSLIFREHFRFPVFWDPEGALQGRLHICLQVPQSVVKFKSTCIHCANFMPTAVPGTK